MLSEPKVADRNKLLLVWLATYFGNGKLVIVYSILLPGPVYPRDDNGSAGHGSSGSTNLSGSRVSTCDPLTHDQVNKIPRTGYFVAVMMFDFESTST